MPNAGSLAATENPLKAMHLNDECDRASSAFTHSPKADVVSEFVAVFAGFDLCSALPPHGTDQERDFLLLLGGIR